MESGLINPEHMRGVLPLLFCLLVGCDDNPCVTLCQQYDRWINTCDTTWEKSFEEQGWKRVDDCLDDSFGADLDQQDVCLTDSDQMWDEACY